jgi:DNA-binding NarL/FixJ family response regulator
VAHDLSRDQALAADDQEGDLHDRARRRTFLERRMTPPGGIRLLIVDDDAVARETLSERFSRDQDINVVGVAAAADEAIRIAADQSPDVVVMEVSIRGMSGAEVARQIRAVSPHSKVVMLTGVSDHQSVLDSIDSGAVGYMYKDDHDDAVVQAIRAAFRGESPMSARAATALLASRRRATEVRGADGDGSPG